MRRWLAGSSPRWSVSQKGEQVKAQSRKEAGTRRAERGPCPGEGGVKGGRETGPLCSLLAEACDRTRGSRSTVRSVGVFENPCGSCLKIGRFLAVTYALGKTGEGAGLEWRGRSEFHSVLDKLRRPVDVRYMDLEPKTRGKTLRVWHVNSHPIPEIRRQGLWHWLYSRTLAGSSRGLQRGTYNSPFIPCN